MNELHLNAWYHVPEERAELFEAENPGATEVEYLELLTALVRCLKPCNVLETGAANGAGSVALSQGLKANGLGRLTSLEHIGAVADEAERRLARFGLSEIARVDRNTSLHFLEAVADEAYDFVFLDSALSLRCRELTLLLDRHLLTSGAVIAIHDTSRSRRNGDRPDPESVTFWEQFVGLRTRLREVFTFTLSRGLLLLTA